NRKRLVCWVVCFGLRCKWLGGWCFHSNKKMKGPLGRGRGARGAWRPIPNRADVIAEIPRGPSAGVRRAEAFAALLERGARPYRRAQRQLRPNGHFVGQPNTKRKGVRQRFLATLLMA